MVIFSPAKNTGGNVPENKFQNLDNKTVHRLFLPSQQPFRGSPQYTRLRSSRLSIHDPAGRSITAMFRFMLLIVPQQKTGS
jgi:hypothetical protein